ncbi:MAG: FeoA family protein [Anaerovoracaceae bacterium]
MNSRIIPLSRAIPGEKYIIDRIENGETDSKQLNRYGFSCGIRIKFLFSNPSCSSHAYEIMGTVIALRHEDAEKIYVCPVQYNIRSINDRTSL